MDASSRSFLRHFPFGTPVPDSPHAVCCSLPTMRDVVAYEEREPAAVKRISQGYPRFVVHSFNRRVAAEILKRARAPVREGFLLPSAAAAEGLRGFLGGDEALIVERDGLHVVAAGEGTDLWKSVKAYIQHTGCAVSSRAAEDWLVSQGLAQEAFSEPTADGDAEATVKAAIAPMLGVPPERLHLCANGMNAFWAAFQAVSRAQAARGRDIWVQLGWLYLDTSRILENFHRDNAKPFFFHNVFDLDSLARFLSDFGARVAGIVAEVPNNPLIETCDVERLAAMAEDSGAALVLDPTIATPANVDVSPYADVLVNSLTKFAASEGDVIAGAVAVNPQSALASELEPLLAGLREPLYRRDAARLAAEVPHYEERLVKINANCRPVVDFLEGHPAVERVYWTGEKRSAAFYDRVKRRPGADGGMITFTLKKPLADFYDKARIVKGPSFGTRFTMMCPFMYLAHYDLVSAAEGRRQLEALGLDPDLIRLSLGTEPADDIVATLAEALD